MIAESRFVLYTTYILILLFIVFGFVFPMSVSAQALSNPGNLQFYVEWGIVPCGTAATTPCTLCDLFLLADNVTDFMVYAGFLVVSVFIGYGGLMILAGSYSESKVQRGKEILTSAIVGLLILLAAWLIVDTAIKLLLGIDVFSVSSSLPAGLGTFGPWNAVQCYQL